MNVKKIIEGERRIGEKEGMNRSDEEKRGELWEEKLTGGKKREE
jgi:hypothetical protein